MLVCLFYLNGIYGAELKSTGKTTLLNVLAQRVDTGVGGGEMLVSGQPLPRDFQAQT